MSETGSATFVGIDIGGSTMRLAIVDAFGRVQSDRQAPTPRDDGDALINWLEEAYGICRGEIDAAEDPSAVGVGVPGILDPTRSTVLHAVNVPSVVGLPLRDMLVERTGLKTVMDSDAVAAAWGEFCVRQRQTKRFGYLTIGTGIGAAVILDGQVMRHTHGSAGHLGHLPCDTSADARRCACGATGCLEAYVAGPALNIAAEAAGFAEGLNQVEPAFQEGDAAAAELIEWAARYLSIGMITVAHIYAIELLVAGGGVTGACPSLIRRAASIAADSDSTLIPQGMAVQLAGLGDCAGVVGAALLAADAFGQRDG
ncbi:MAG: ROK family protein [Phycisphaerales bacterium]|nr:ROK family protein [Phycisphaerales bacterium]